MKILFCINSLEKGGAERVVCNLSNYLSTEYDISILTMINSKPQYPLNENIKLYHLDKKIKDFNKKSNTLSKLLKLILRKINMRKMIKFIEPDIIISFLPEISFLVLSSSRKNDKIIVSVRNDPKIEYSSKIYNFFMKKLYVRANGFVFQTMEAKEYFQGIIDCEVSIIPNPINPDFIELPYNGIRKKEIVSVGRLVPQKNFDLLIDGFFELSDNYLKDYNLVIYGEGNLREKLEKKIVKLGLENRVFLPGIVDNVKDKIYDSSLFVLTSLYEGMPNALMEAMALGLPVLSSDCPCGGPRELINNGVSGYLFENNNKKDLEDKIVTIISNVKLMKEISKNANNICNTHDPKVLNKKWEDFIKLIMEER